MNHQRGESPYYIQIGLSREPKWPNGIVGSITHTGTFASAVLGFQKHHIGMGIDAEEVLLNDKAYRLDKTILTHNEISFYKSRYQNDFSYGQYVSLLFSAKESLYKCFFYQHKKFIGFLEVEILDIDIKNSNFNYQFLIPIGDKKTQPKGQGNYQFFEKLIYTFVTI